MNSSNQPAVRPTPLAQLADVPPGSALGRLIRLPLRLIPRNHVAIVRQGINQGSRWVVGTSIHGCWLGTYEQEKQSLVERIVNAGMVVWDVGANAGFYTLAFARLVQPSGRVYAFEPFAENAHHLLRHVQLNQLENTVVVQAALAAQAGLVSFAVAESNSMGHISGTPTAYVVPAWTADDFLKQFPESVPQLLKIDVEGAESAVLSGASGLLSRHAPEILLALHGEAAGGDCSRILHAHGYQLFYLDGTPANSLPFRSDEIHARKVP